MKVKKELHRYTATIGFTTPKDARPQFKQVTGTMNVPIDWEGENGKKAFIQLELLDSEYKFKAEVTSIELINKKQHAAQ